MAVEKASIPTAVEIVGSILNKVRDCALHKLKDCDLTNNELRQVLARDLKEINTKLDSLSLKDLETSCRFLKECMSFLILTLDNPSEDQETHEAPGEATANSAESSSGSLKAIQKLQLSSVKRLEETMKSFHDAQEVSDVFNNKSQTPSVKNRILACKIRLAARIFESDFENTEAAVSACLLALKELHGLPEILHMFKVFLNGGMRSWLNKAERLENIMSVLFINHALFDFAAKCSSKYPNVFTWPTIELANRTIHPIQHAYDIVEKTSSGEELGRQLDRMVVDRRISGYPRNFAVNSLGEIILLLDADGITVIYSSGRTKDVKFSDLSESNGVLYKQKAVAVDSDDNVYVLRYLKTHDENSTKGTFVFCVLDANYNIQHDSKLLDFLNTGEDEGVEIAVDKNKNTIFIENGDNQVFVCDNRGKLKFKFERDGDQLSSIGITDKNEIMVESDDGRAVYVYTTEGSLKSRIKVPKDHFVLQSQFHHGICKIIVLTFERKRGSRCLLCYTETGELEHSMRAIPWRSEIASHPSGTFAVLQDEIITLI